MLVHKAVVHTWETRSYHIDAEAAASFQAAASWRVIVFPSPFPYCAASSFAVERSIGAS